MPLTEREQRLLRQMEEALSEQDPDFVSQMQGAGVKITARRRIAIGAVGVLVGLGLVLIGVTTSLWVGATGFGLMVAAVAFAVAAPGRRIDLLPRTRSGHR
jgi:hypothetical protein